MASLTCPREAPETLQQALHLFLPRHRRPGDLHVPLVQDYELALLKIPAVIPSLDKIPILLVS